MKYEDSMFNIYVTIDNEELITLTKKSDELSCERNELENKLKFFRNEIRDKRKLGYSYVEEYILDLTLEILDKESDVLNHILSLD